jgi:hypothetical protein
MYTFNEAEELGILIETEAKDREANLKLTDNPKASDIIIANLLNEMALTAKNLADELAVEKYKVAFIGQIASGKTTTICHLLDLTFETKTERTVNKRQRVIKEMQTVLTVSSGGTTMCEVELRASPNTSIELEPYTNEETIQILKIFAEYIISKVDVSSENDNENDEEKNSESLPKELRRAIRNIVMLPERSSASQNASLLDSEPFQLESQKEPSKIKTPATDQAIALYKKFQESGKSDDEFIAEIIRLAKLDERNVNILFPNQNENLTSWMYETFNKINVGLYPKMALPKKIIINISFAPLLNKFESFIDTKGLDDGSPRANISDLMESIDTLCVFTSKFEFAPEPSITEFLKRATTFNSKKHYERHMFLVLPRKNEAERKLTDGGKHTDDFEEGTKIQTDEILDKFRRSGIKLTEHQIFFYNPLKHYIDDKYPDAELIDDISEEKQKLFEAIEQLGIQKRKLTSDRLSQICEDFEQIKNGGLSDEDTDRLFTLKEQLKLHTLLNFVAETFKTKLVAIYRDTRNTKNARTKHYLNSNEWINPLKYIDVALNFKQLYARVVIPEYTKTKIDEIKNDINKLESPDGSPIFKQVSKQLFEIFETKYTNFKIKIETIFSDIIESKLNLDFFQELKDEWGQGNVGGKYTDRVCDDVAKWIDKNNIRNEFESKVNQEWRTTIESFIYILN